MSLSTPLKKQFPLKLLGIDNIICSNEEVLEFLELYVPPSSISYLHFDSYHTFYVVFLNDIDSVCTLVGKRLSYSQCKIDILPLLDYYVVRNVYPDLTNEDLIDLFRPFGNVYDVKAHHVLPNSSKFSHVLSGNREISFMLPGHEIGVSVPGSVIHLPHTFHVIKYCPACSTEGHALLHCPDIEDSCLPQETSVELESDLELEDFNVKGMLSDDDKFLIANEGSEQSNDGENSLEKVDDVETIMCGTLENSQETTNLFLSDEGSEQSNDGENSLEKVDGVETICGTLENSQETTNLFLLDEGSEQSNDGENSLEKVDGVETIICGTLENSQETTNLFLLDEGSEQSNDGENSLEKVDGVETIICGTLENSQENKEVYKEKRKYNKRKHWIDARWTISTKTRKSSKTVVYCVKRKYKKRKDHEKHNRMHANSEQSKKKKSRGKRKWRRAPFKRGRPRNNPEAQDQPSLLIKEVTKKTYYERRKSYKLKQTLKHNSKKETKIFLKKAPLKIGRPRKNPEALDQPPLLQNSLITTPFKRGRPRKNLEALDQPPLLQKVIEKMCWSRETPGNDDEVSVQTPSLPEKITGKSPLKVGRPRKNLEALDQPPSLQKVMEKMCLSRETPGNDDEVSVQTPSLPEKITGKSPLKVGRPRKNLEALDQPPLLQNSLFTTPFKRGRPRKNLEALDQPPSLQKVMEKTCLGQGRPRNNPEVLNQTFSLQDIREESADEDEIWMKSFSLHASLEKKVRNSEDY